MRKHLLTLICALCALLLISNTGKADNVIVGSTHDTYGNGSGTTYALSYAFPMTTRDGDSHSIYSSLTQQIFLASELGASAKNITGVSFYAGGASNTTAVTSSGSRNIEVWMMEIDDDSFTMSDAEIGQPTRNKYAFICDATTKRPGTRVYSGTLASPTVTSGGTAEFTINFNENFEWSGEKNILLTFVDSTKSTVVPSTSLRWQIFVTDKPRYVHRYWIDQNQVGWVGNLIDKYGDYYGSNTTEKQVTNHKFVAKTKFTYSIPVDVPMPTSPYVDNQTISSADIHWTAAEGAESYEIHYGTSSGIYDTTIDNISGTSYALTGLTDGTAYYYQIRTKIGENYSSWTTEASFNTAAITHEHDGISFSKWSSTTSLPSEEGNYYLNADVALSGNYTIPGNINLCLNGHSIYTDAYYITVPNNKTLAVYDNVGGGRIYGYYAIEIEYSNNGLITVDADGTLILNGVSVENLANQFNDGEAAYGIYSIGTLKISGASVISGYDADIHLYSGRVITIESDKPLTNTTPYRILTSSIGDITSGWANMNGANPSDYLTSAPTARGVCLNSTSGEARYVRRLRVNENDDNEGISDALYANQLINVSITRSVLTSASYNTFCLPFPLTDAQLEEIFGTGYDLEKFVSSSLEGDVLNLVFNKVTSLEAGKPYLLQPSVDVANPSFEGVTIAATEPADQTSDANISFHATFAPTELEGGNKNLLFLGAENELFYPASTANIKAFRAYFELKGAAVNSAPKARIVKKQDSATGIENQMVNGKCGNHKFLKDGQLYILREGKMYNVLGMEK